MASMKVILGSPIFLQKCSFIMKSKHLFFSGPNAHHYEHEAGPVSRQWGRRPEARSSMTMSGLHIPDVVWTRKRHHWKQRKSPVAQKHIFYTANSGPWIEPSRGQPMTHRSVLSIFRPLGLLGGNALNRERDFVIEMSIMSFQITSPLGSKIYVEVISWKTCSPTRGFETTSAIGEGQTVSPQTYFQNVQGLPISRCRLVILHRCPLGLEKKRFKATCLAPTKFSGRFPQSTKDSEASTVMASQCITLQERAGADDRGPH